MPLKYGLSDLNVSDFLLNIFDTRGDGLKADISTLAAIIAVISTATYLPKFKINYHSR